MDYHSKPFIGDVAESALNASRGDVDRKSDCVKEGDRLVINVEPYQVDRYIKGEQ